MPDIGVPELLIIAAIVLLVFGPGKAADLGASLGKGIREFRKATKEEDTPAPPAATNVLASAAGPGAGQPASANGATAAAGRFCTECGSAVADGQRFCSNCGAALATKAS